MKQAAALDSGSAAVGSATIMHIDIVGSTDLVRKNVVLAHQQIQSLYSRIRRICQYHNGIARELRGDPWPVTRPFNVRMLLARGPQ